jgi:hypothetical protein
LGVASAAVFVFIIAAAGAVSLLLTGLTREVLSVPFLGDEDKTEDDSDTDDDDLEVDASDEESVDVSTVPVDLVLLRLPGKSSTSITSATRRRGVFVAVAVVAAIRALSRDCLVRAMRSLLLLLCSCIIFALARRYVTALV